MGLLQHFQPIVEEITTENAVPPSENPSIFSAGLETLYLCQRSQADSPAGFGHGRADPAFLRDNRAGLWEKGFLKPKPGPAWITTQA